MMVLSQVMVEYGTLAGGSLERLMNQATTFASDNVWLLAAGLVACIAFIQLLNRL